MKQLNIACLENSPVRLAEAVSLLSSNCPSGSERYGISRLKTEIISVDVLPFYKRFFGAYTANGLLIWVGGIKAADWASDTHIMYMMAVDKAHRGKGVDTALEKARIEWVRDNFAHGRYLVSTKHKKRFERWGFKVVSEINDKLLMVMDF